jgi:hypothetical protein
LWRLLQCKLWPSASRRQPRFQNTKIKEIFTGELNTLLGYENIVAEKGDPNYTDKAGSKTRLENHGNFTKNSVNPGSFI